MLLYSEEEGEEEESKSVPPAMVVRRHVLRSSPSPPLSSSQCPAGLQFAAAAAAATNTAATGAAGEETGEAKQRDDVPKTLGTPAAADLMAGCHQIGQGLELPAELYGGFECHIGRVTAADAIPAPLLSNVPMGRSISSMERTMDR